jgi:hypothetical protein
VKQVRDLTKSEIEASIEHLNEIVDKLGDGSLRKRVIMISDRAAQIVHDAPGGLQ